jgi:4-diphosphocytidyl-2-C-methyl-D-erythritol kinase
VDGFHDLVSVATPVEFGDTLTIERRPAAEAFTLTCDEPTLEVDATNLVLRAAQAFAEASGVRAGAKFTLVKRIPLGAGLGGGSSNATAALVGLNQLHGAPLATAQLVEIAGRLGSDCALFLANAPVVMRGRGERVEPLPAGAAVRLKGRRVLIFKPTISINTGWAYGRLAAGAPGSYLAAGEAEARLARWIEAGDGTAEAAVEALLFNNMEAPAFEKFLTLPVMLEALRVEFGLAPRMSGSGSACYALLDDAAPVPAICARIREGWGAEAFVKETRLG